MSSNYDNLITTNLTTLQYYVSDINVHARPPYSYNNYALLYGYCSKNFLCN